MEKSIKNYLGKFILLICVFFAVYLLFYGLDLSTIKSFNEPPKEFYLSRCHHTPKAQIKDEYHLCRFDNITTMKVLVNGTLLNKFYNHTHLNGSKKTVTCSRWVYDVAEWTLKYTNETCESSFPCPTPTNIKRIIHPNSTSKLIGCNESTTRCKDRAHFSYEYGIRINTPPCCRDHIIEVFRHFTNELQTMGVDHQLTFGGVIGWCRNRKMIPYDSDLDVLVRKNFWKSHTFDVVLRNLKSKYGHTTVWQDGGEKLQIQYSAVNHNGIDVWFMEEYGPYGNRYYVDVPNNDWHRQPRHFLLPSQPGVFEGIRTFLPNKPLEFLDSTYGRGKWQKPLSCKRWDNRCLT